MVDETASGLLTRREREVAVAASGGRSNKLIAHELGTATSTIAVHLSRVSSKLGLPSRAALILRFNAGTIDFTDARLAPLSPSERDVLERVAQGASNRLIAELRGSSPRTVANQIVSIFRKLGVASRGELVAFMTRSASLL